MKTDSPDILRFYIILIMAFLLTGILSCSRTSIIKLETLLDEMISLEEMSEYPDPYYKCRQASSYDRASVSPDSLNWFRNKDGFEGGNFIRIDTIDGRIEKVMMDEKYPGAITRFWITSYDRVPTIRFYFDGSDQAGWVIPGYDMMKFGIKDSTDAIIIPHPSYNPTWGGSTSFFPVPYSESCKVTVEIPDSLDMQPRYYHINYRRYNKDVNIETFSGKVLERAGEKINYVNRILRTGPELPGDMINDKTSARLSAGESISLQLPTGNNAVYMLNIKVIPADKAIYDQLMRELILRAEFDSRETIWAPLGDFSGGGMGAPEVKSWFLNADGKGSVSSKWLMPYKKSGVITIENTSSGEADVEISAYIKKHKWGKNSLYFHTSWKQSRDLWLSNCGEDYNKPTCKEWRFAEIKGKGVYKGDVLSLFNRSKSWYGEGDEKIWVDNESFPSHFGTGTEDYYNNSWGVFGVSHTPYGGAVRADTTSYQGYNSWLRTRNLDGIPFRESFVFDLEQLSWFAGTADYSSTIYWYGSVDSQAIGTSGTEES